MLTQEEIRIKAGLDYSGVTAGLSSIRGQVNKLAADVPKKLTGLLKANLYTAAAGIIAEILPSWQEIWDRIYNTGPESMAREAAFNKSLRDVVERVQRARKELADVQQKEYFDKAPMDEKIEMVTTDLENAQEAYKKNADIQKSTLREQKKLRKEINNLLEQKRFDDGYLNQDLSIKAQNIVIDSKVLKLQEKLTEIRNKYAKAVEEGSKASIEEINLKKQLMTLEEKQSEDARAARAKLETKSVEPGAMGGGIINPMYQGLSDYYKKVSAGFQAYGLNGESDKYKALADSFYQAQSDALKENIVNVRIKEVE